MILVAAVFFLVLTACAGPPGPTKPTYVGGLSGCADFWRTMTEASQGILTDVELREMLKKVQSRTSSAEPAIREASTRVLATMTSGDGPAFSAASAALITACQNAGYK